MPQMVLGLPFRTPSSSRGSDTMGSMEPQEFWNTYMQGMRPADFMSAFDEADPALCVTEYVRQRPSFYGIVRRRNWQETFVPGEPQFTRESVRAALITHLEETRPEWESVSAEIRYRRQEDRRRRIEEATRAREAAAVAAAVAAVTAAAAAAAAAAAPPPPPAPVPAEAPLPAAAVVEVVAPVSDEMDIDSVIAPHSKDVPLSDPAPNAAD